MKVSLQWLNDYIDISDYFDKPQELADLLTDAGLEVESITNRGKDLDKVVVGHILKLGRHPDADRLTLCEVTTGEGVVHQVICGAKNHKEDDRVVVALPGAVLPGGFKIKKSKIRGVESSGMLCSERELALSEEAAGIIILPEDAPIGQPFAQYQGLDDVILEIGVTPNRSDCLSHFGLARELSCLLDRPFEFPIKSLNESSASTRDEITLQVTNTDMCPRYAGRSVKGVKVGKSPAWLVKRLESVGINSINNVVDVTNYVMFELGQPLHAFDQRFLVDDKIIVQASVKGEKFKSFDGTEFELTGEELTIRDANKAVALAGIIGGENSGVKDDTTDLFVESAYFVPSIVRRTSRRFGVDTDSSYRFSRGVDPDAVLLGMNRACQLIQELCGGEILATPHDNYPQPIKTDSIEISLVTVTDRMGYSVQSEDFEKWMQRLGCQLTDKGDGIYSILPPAFRPDLQMDMDLVEEYGRLQGYELIPDSIPELSTEPSKHDPNYELQNKIRGLLAGDGYMEAIHYAFESSRFEKEVLGDFFRLERFGLNMGQGRVPLKNPLNEEMDVMRISLVPGLVKNLSQNVRRGTLVGRVFEIGPAYMGTKSGSYSEDWRIGLSAWGSLDGVWQKQSPCPVVFEIKSTIENLLFGLNGKQWQWKMAEDKNEVPEFLHPGQTACLFYEGKNVGFVGSLHPSLREEQDIRVDAAIAELNFAKLVQGQPRIVKAKAISKFPAVERDLAFVLPRDLPADNVLKEMQKQGGELLRDVRIFDVFTGGNLGEDKRSVAYRLTFQDLNDTLSDDQIKVVQDKLIKALADKFSIQVR